MPKKKKQARRPVKRRQVGPLLLSPAKTLLELIEMDADEEALQIAAHWPYQVERGPSTSIVAAAAEVSMSVRETATAMALMEDSKHLAWDGANNRYLLTVPDGTP